MEYFRPAESKSKTVVKLDVNLPGMVRRGSKSKSPLPRLDGLAREQVSESGLTGETDTNELRRLDSLTIEFSNAGGMCLSLANSFKQY